MFEGIKTAWHEVWETFAGEGLKRLIRRRIFWNRQATPVVMDLKSMSAFPLESLLETGCQPVELSIEDIRTGKLIFIVPSRRYKALRNIERGWRGFALVQENLVIGDVWCVTPCRDKTPVDHADLAMLDIICEQDDAYAFDMYIALPFRGKNLAVPLQRSLQTVLKTEGFSKVYGYYWNDNLPALWMHRMLKYKELPKRSICRCFFLQRSRNAV